MKQNLNLSRIELQKLALELGISRATAYRWAGTTEQLVGNDTDMVKKSIEGHNAA